jgi:hypothetical protein
VSFFNFGFRIRKEHEKIIRFDVKSFGFGWFPTRVAGEDGGATVGRPLHFTFHLPFVFNLYSFEITIYYERAHRADGLVANLLGGGREFEPWWRIFINFSLFFPAALFEL